MLILDRVCFGCGISIDDPYYLMMVNQSWHFSCLKCSDCGILLEQEKRCFTKNGQIFCKDDYIKYVFLYLNFPNEMLFSRRYCSCVCTRCNRIIKPNENILRVEDFIFHFECLSCIICNIIFHPGDEFGLKNNIIYCRDHFIEQQSYDSNIILDDSGYHTSPSNEKRKLKIDEEHFLVLSPSSYYIEMDDNQLNRSDYSKQKRLRTSFKHHQLRYMRSYFNLNHNPGLN